MPENRRHAGGDFFDSHCTGVSEQILNGTSAQ